MSKQSNQRYRKERDKELIKKEENSATTQNNHDKDKINREFDASSNKADR